MKPLLADRILKQTPFISWKPTRASSIFNYYEPVLSGPGTTDGPLLATLSYRFQCILKSIFQFKFVSLFLHLAICLQPV